MLLLIYFVVIASLSSYANIFIKASDDAFHGDASSNEENTVATMKKINVRRFDLSISMASLNPDCFNQSYPMLVVNNQFPAPALHVVKNDVVRLYITSDGFENNQSSSIHIHGIRQYGTSFSDGVAGVTQLSILPGQQEDFVQEFQVLNQSGTYYYHAHVGVQDDTIQGPFIVHETEEFLLAATKRLSIESINEGCCTYDDERILQWTEWWHQSAYNRAMYYMSPNFINDGGPDSVLLNGRTVYNSNDTIDSDIECKGFHAIDVEPNKIYRFRFIGALTFRMLGIFIQDHNMTLIEIDGEYVEPHEINYLEIAAGQRMSVLIKTGNYPAGTLFPIASNFRWRVAGPTYTKNGYGYLRYTDNPGEVNNNIIMDMPSINSFPTNIFPPTDTPGWVLDKVKPLVTTEKDLKITNGENIPQTIKLSMIEVIEADNTTRFRNNGRVHVPWGTLNASLIDQILSGSLGPVGELSNLDGFSTNHQTYPIAYGQVVDIVFQNNLLPSGICVAHPWHTHGHSHYLLAEGPGDYVHEKDKDIRTFSTPLLKDVSIAYPVVVNGSVGCGWTKVRIFTDNPGIWAIHCHITAHMLQGKMVIFEVASDMIQSVRRTFDI